MSKLDDDLRREVLSFIPTKAIKITDAFVNWWKTNYRTCTKHKFLGIKITDAKLIKDNFSVSVYTINEKNDNYTYTFLFGTETNMRLELDKLNKGARKYYEQRIRGERERDEWEDEEGEPGEWEDIIWQDYIFTTFELDGETYYIDHDPKQMFMDWQD